MVVYADVVFLINFIMDVFILWTVNAISKSNSPFYKIISGGFVMSFLYCLLIFTVQFKIYISIFSTTAILFLGILTAFKIKKFKEFFKLVFLAYVSAFAIGGIGMAIFYSTNTKSLIANATGISVNGFSIKILMIATSISYIIIKIFLNWQNNLVLKKQVFYSTKIFYDDKPIEIRALVDTGNSLADPITKTPVIIAEFNSIKEFLPTELKIVFYEKKENDLSYITNLQEQNIFNERMRIIPFMSIGQKSGMLIGFRPDKIEITRDESVELVENVIVGIYNNKLSNDDSYQGLLNPKIIT